MKSKHVLPSSILVMYLYYTLSLYSYLFLFCIFSGIWQAFCLRLFRIVCFLCCLFCVLICLSFFFSNFLFVCRSCCLILCCLFLSCSNMSSQYVFLISLVSAVHSMRLWPGLHAFASVYHSSARAFRFR